MKLTGLTIVSLLGSAFAIPAAFSSSNVAAASSGAFAAPSSLAGVGEQFFPFRKRQSTLISSLAIPSSFAGASATPSASVIPSSAASFLIRKPALSPTSSAVPSAIPSSIAIPSAPMTPAASIPVFAH